LGDKVKVKGKVMQNLGSGGTAPFIHNSTLDAGEWSVSCPAALPSEQVPNE
jgi:hypothetical protein